MGCCQSLLLHTRRVAFIVKGKKRQDKGLWSDLPTDILELIIQKIIPPKFDDIIHDFKDFRSFKSVCHSWRNVAKASTSYLLPSPQIPWLLLDLNNEHSTLFDPSTNKFVCKLNNPYWDSHKFRCVGSSHGWIVMLRKHKRRSMCCDACEAREPMVNLYNPITRDSIPIPDTQTLHGYNITKGIISSNPSSNNSFYVVVAYQSGLAFYNYGGNQSSWIKFGGEEEEELSYYDIVFHNGRRVFVQTRWSLEVWDFRQNGSTLIPIKTMHIEESSALVRAHLVESLAGDHILRLGETREFTSRFRLEKLNLSEEKWETVESLGGGDDDDDQVFVCFRHELLSFSRSCFVEELQNCEGNFIVFDTLWECFIIGNNPPALKVRNLWDLFGKPRIQPKYLDDEPCVWVYPNPW